MLRSVPIHAASASAQADKVHWQLKQQDSIATQNKRQWVLLASCEGCFPIFQCSATALHKATVNAIVPNRCMHEKKHSQIILVVQLRITSLPPINCHCS